MKKNLIIGTALLLCFGCTNSNKTSAIVEDNFDKTIIGPIIVGNTANIKQPFECNFETVDGPQSGGIKIRFGNELVDTVISELEGKDSINNFWSYLTLPTKQELIYQINKNLAQEKNNSLFPFKAVAVFFGEIARTGDREKAYLLKLSKAETYRFMVFDEKIRSTVSLDAKCDDKFLSLSTISTPKEIISAANLKEMYFCQTTKDSFQILSMGDSTMVASHMDIVEVGNALVAKKESESEISLNISTSDISLKMKFMKNQIIGIKGTFGNKTKVNISTQTLDINTTASCNRVVKEI